MSILDHPSVAQTSERPAKTLTVRPWWDATLAQTGHSPMSSYVERYWLGVLGPSVICLLRRFGRGFVEHPDGFQIVLADTARAIGLGAGTGGQAPINRTIDRACTFNVARRISEEELVVRTHLPRLNQRQLARLPLAIRNSHAAWTALSEPVVAAPSAGHAA